ncbi:MAG: S24 family peptidase, partial [Campylobacterota bacterium]|nr:S24 family peptidase [Campylobacterota bacterium]
DTFFLADILDATEQDFFVGAKQRREKIAFEEIRENPLKYKHIFNKENVKNELKQIGFKNNKLKSIYVDNICLEKELLNDEIFAFFVSGDSMYPYLSADDIVLYIPIRKDSIKSDGKFVIDTSVGLQVKNIKFMLNGSVRIISENKSYHSYNGYDEEILKDNMQDLKIIGSVVGRINKS